MINETIIKYVNKIYNTSYVEVNDEVFYKFFNSELFNIEKYIVVNKWSYEAMIYLLKNIVQYYCVNIVDDIYHFTTYNQICYGNKMFYKNALTNIDNKIYESSEFKFIISIKNFDYIINKIVEWTISDSSFKDFVEDTKEDRKFNSNLLQFVISSLGYSLYHKRYILYIIYKYAEAMNYETIIYLFDINIMWNYSDFDNYYKELINKRFNEELFKISDEDNYNDYYIPEDKENIYKKELNDIHVKINNKNHILDSLLYHLQYNDLEEYYKARNYNFNVYYLNHEYINGFTSFTVVQTNSSIVLFNYLVLSNRINDLKTMLLTTDIGYLLNIIGNTPGGINKDYYSLKRKEYNVLINNIDLKKFITIEVYRILLSLNISSSYMELLCELSTTINIDIHKNYMNNYLEEHMQSIEEYNDQDKEVINKYTNNTINYILSCL